MKRLDSRWDEGRRIVRTELRGEVTVGDVERWQAELRGVVGELPAGTFKLLFDLRGYEPASLDAHKAMRTVVPGLLAEHGLRPAVLDLFDRADAPPIAEAPAARCVAFANVHHDVAKMADYERRIGRPAQRFFTDFTEAERWLDAVV